MIISDFEKNHIKDKAEKYKQILIQIKSLIDGESDLIANYANVSSVLKYNFDDFSWVGFYIWRKKELVLGPFQGKPACTRIKKGRGVCGIVVQEKRTIIVPDVNKFPGHIYCDPSSKSEIVIPIIRNGKVIGVLDIDSHKKNTFDDIDRLYLEVLVKTIIGQGD